jgi:hypothetical protein
LEEKRNLLSEQVIHGSNAGMRNELETELRAVPLRYVFIPMRLRLSAVFGHRHRVDKNFRVTEASKLLRPTADV